MSEETENIKDRLDIVEIISEYVTLKQAGQHFKGLCPFHQEKTPSFIVSPGKRIWHCFGCQKGGDIFSFIQEIDQLDFPGTLALLADRAGVTLKKKSPSSTNQRQRILDLLDLTGRFYHEILMHQSAGHQSKDYLIKRGVKPAAMRLFQLGYAPHRWDTIQNFLRSKGFSPQEMITAGVVGTSQQGTLYDRFRGRIIFPIEDIQGRTIAFGGRITPWHTTGEEGKYINSPETKLYEKKRVIYNLHRAKQSVLQTKSCLVVEGYLDVLMSTQVGISNVVASSGTAFTPQALTQLGRLTDNINFSFDADAAGTKAAITAARLALNAGLRVGLIILPGGSDPADLAQSAPTRLKELVSKPQSLLTVLITKLKQTTGQSMNDYLNELLPLINASDNPIFQGEMIQELAATLHLPESRLISQLEKTAAQTSLQTNFSPPTAQNQADMSSSVITSEQLLLGLFIAYPDSRPFILAELKSKYLLADDIKSLYNIVHGLMNNHQRLVQASADALITRIPTEYISLAEGLRHLSQEHINQAQGKVLLEGQALLRAVKILYFKQQLDRLEQELETASESDKQAKLAKIKQLQQKSFATRQLN